MSLSIEEVILTLKALKVPSDLLVKAETQFEQIEAEKKEEKADAAPKAKNEYATILLDPENKLAGLGDFVSLVVQVPEGSDTGMVLPKIYKAIYDQKAAAKKKPKKLDTVCDAAEGLKRAFTKQNEIMIKTKSPVRTLISNNTVPAA